MAGKKINDLTALGRDLASTDLLELSLAGGTGSRKITGQQIINAIPLPPSGITIGTTAITSGTVGRVLFEGTGNVVQESANLFWDNTNGRLGIGTSSPTNELSVYGNTNGVVRTRIENISTGTLAFSDLNIRNSVGGVVLQVTGTGNTVAGVTANQARFRTDSSISNGIFISTGGASPIIFATSDAEKLRISGTTGNVLINTTTDAGFKLDVNGTARIQNQLSTIGSITASGATARGVYFNNTLLAAANGDILSGLDITPTFTNGAFTGVSNYLLNMSSPSVSGASIFVSKFAFNNGWVINIKNGTTNQTGTIFQEYGLELGSSNTNVGGLLKGKWGVGYGGGLSSVPVTLSVNGSVGIGITTDAGYKLDVNGTARVTGDLTLGTGNGFLRGNANFVQVFSSTDQLNVFSSARGAVVGTLGLFGATELKPSGGIAFSSIGISQTAAFVAISQGSTGNTNPESFIVNRGFFGNIVATDKNILRVSSTLNSNIANATLLRGIYVDINDTTTFTGFADFRAIESPRGGAYFNTTSVNASAILQADSTTKGFLPPRMTTTQINAIASPAEGLQVYNTTINHMCFYMNGAWQKINHSPM